MSDHQRIYPVHDVEAPLRPTAPLVPRNASKSDMVDPLDYPPLPQCTIPLMHSKPPKKRSCCCKFLCWTFSMLLILIIATAITIGVLYHAMDKLSNNSLYVTFNVTITARNPNKKIGIYHEGRSHISSWYMDTQLREGSLQNFYQGHLNTTVLNFPLTGQTQDATGLENKVQQHLHQTNNIPFNRKVKQPVRIKLGKSVLSVEALEKMMEDPTVQKMVYPYLPEEMRNPTTFKWMLQNPRYRQQLEEMLNNMSGSNEWDSRTMDTFKFFDLNNPEAKQQFDQIRLSPEEVISNIMANPEVAMAFQNPIVQAAIMDVLQPRYITIITADKAIVTTNSFNNKGHGNQNFSDADINGALGRRRSSRRVGACAWAIT